MTNWRRLFLIFTLVLLLNIVVVPVLAEEAPFGQFAFSPQLIGYWELIPPHPDLSANPMLNPGSTPFQWFAFYADGKMVSIKTSDPLRKVTPRDLDSILKNCPNQVGSFGFRDGFVMVSEPGAAASRELWGVNVITRKIVMGKVEHLPGDIIMSLDGGGKVIFYRHLRRIFLSEYAVGKSDSPIKSLPVAAKDGQIISAAEREMIRTLVPYFTAVSNKDTVTMKKLFPGLRSQSDDRLRSFRVKNYILNGLEDVTYDGSRLRAVAIYSFEEENPDAIGRNIAVMSADVHLALENGSWVIVGWFQQDTDRPNMEYFQSIFSRQERAEKRYGVTNLAKWDGL